MTKEEILKKVEEKTLQYVNNDNEIDKIYTRLKLILGRAYKEGYIDSSMDMNNNERVNDNE